MNPDMPILIDAPTCPTCPDCGEPLLSWDDGEFVCPCCTLFDLPIGAA